MSVSRRYKINLLIYVAFSLEKKCFCEFRHAFRALIFLNYKSNDYTFWNIFRFTFITIFKSIFCSNSEATGSENITYALRTGTSELTSGISSQSCSEQWFVEPELVLLDSKKGSRVRIVNNSSKILRLVLFWFFNRISVYTV